MAFHPPNGGGGGGSGTVTSVSVTTANGVSGVVANATTTPAITLTLGAITPSSVVSTGALRSNTSLILEETGAGTDTITIQAPAAIGASYTLTLPDTDGDASQFLQTNGSGVLSWQTIPGGGDMLVATYDPAGIAQQVVGLTASQTMTNKTLTAPVLTTPTLGVASATTINKVAITAPASGSTLTIADGKTLTASNTLTFTGTDASSVAFGAGGTVAYVANKLSVFAATTSAELAGVISDETGSGVLVFATSPTLVTPVLGAATATSINGLTITSSTGTLTVANGKTLTASNSLTFAGTDGNTLTFPSGNDTVATLTATQTFTNKRNTQRVVTMADATGITPTADTADMNTQVNTQAAGTLTVNAPSGTPTNGQKLILRIQSSNVQTFSWNAIFRGSLTVALPSATTGSSKTDYFGFIYNSTDTKWDCVSVVYGYT